MDRNNILNVTGAAESPAAQSIGFGDLPDPNSENFDGQVFTELVKNLKGNRSAREFALNIDVSESFVNKAVSGHIKRPPAKRTMFKLLCTPSITPALRRKLIKAAGYPEDQIDWTAYCWETSPRHQVSAAEAITRFYGGNDYLAMGRLMSSLATHGVDGDMTSYVHRDKGYFEVKDEATGQVYVGINTYCSTVGDKDAAVWSMVFSLALIFNKVCQSEHAHEKIVIIMTNQERIFEGCQTLEFSKIPLSTVVVLTDDFKGFSQEKVLHGEFPISLLDEIPG